MSQALAVVNSAAPAVTSEQIDLIKRTIASGSTPDELKLYLYDCARQGVHPLDKLIHFTKRAGKYTPITSIDFMRIRAADTGEYAGSDDAAFVGEATKADFAATVTVWRLVQGQRVPFTATARWSEYKPDQNAFMWTKMPHTMLAKCAEALALRKGFPRQLAGLYAKEEMDQAERGGGYTVEAPKEHAGTLQANSAPVVDAVSDGRDGVREMGENPAPAPLRILKVEKAPTNGPHPIYDLTFSDGQTVRTGNDEAVSVAEQLCQDGADVEIVRGPRGGFRAVKRAGQKAEPAPTAPMVDASEIPF